MIIGLIRILTFLSILSLNNQAWSQVNENHDHGEDHKHGHKNEISLASGVVFVPTEDEIGASLHLHYIRGLGERKIVGLGGGVEGIFEEHKHVTFSAIIHFRIYKGLTAGYSPGLLILIEDMGKEIQFAQHFEIAYEFEIGRVHLGPVFELGLEKEGLHYMGGVHIGIDF